jgi:hypothetical protein
VLATPTGAFDQIGDLIVTTSISVPDQQERTRDMGSVEQHSTARPPFVAVMDALHQLEISYGTAALAEALQAYRNDLGFHARKQGVDPESFIRDIEALYAVLELPSDGTVARAKKASVATPYPGIAA